MDVVGGEAEPAQDDLGLGLEPVAAQGLESSNPDSASASTVPASWPPTSWGR